MEFYSTKDLIDAFPPWYAELTERDVSSLTAKDVFTEARSRDAILQQDDYPERILVSFDGMPEIMTHKQLEERLEKLKN